MIGKPIEEGIGNWLLSILIQKKERYKFPIDTDLERVEKELLKPFVIIL